MANRFKFRSSRSRLGYARPFDSSYAYSILTGDCGAAAFSPLFYGKNLFQNGVAPDKRYGNVWIKLSGSHNPHLEDDIIGDFAKAEEVAKDYGLFVKMPENYTWHYAFMGWFDYEAFLNARETNVNQLQCLSTEGILNSFPETSLHELTIDQGAYRNDHTNVYDARSWTNCFEKDFEFQTNWIPDEDHYSLLQLIPKELHEDSENSSLGNGSVSSYGEKFHYGSCEQYQTYFQALNIYKKYSYSEY